jgi:hypothetical protein
MNKEQGKNPYQGHGETTKKGGPTSMDRKKYGRQMSRALNQRGSARGR